VSYIWLQPKRADRRWELAKGALDENFVKRTFKRGRHSPSESHLWSPDLLKMLSQSLAQVTKKRNNGDCKGAPPAGPRFQGKNTFVHCKNMNFLLKEGADF
jgi:hypothetical protein